MKYTSRHCTQKHYSQSKRKKVTASVIYKEMMKLYSLQTNKEGLTYHEDVFRRRKNFNGYMQALHIVTSQIESLSKILLPQFPFVNNDKHVSRKADLALQLFLETHTKSSMLRHFMRQVTVQVGYPSGTSTIRQLQQSFCLANLEAITGATAEFYATQMTAEESLTNFNRRFLVAYDSIIGLDCQLPEVVVVDLFLSATVGYIEKRSKLKVLQVQH